MENNDFHTYKNNYFVCELPDVASGVRPETKPLPLVTTARYTIKLGRGHWDACVGTWDLGTRGEGHGDVGTCGPRSQGRQI